MQLIFDPLTSQLFIHKPFLKIVERINTEMPISHGLSYNVPISKNVNSNLQYPEYNIIAVVDDIKVFKSPTKKQYNICCEQCN